MKLIGSVTNDARSTVRRNALSFRPGAAFSLLLAALLWLPGSAAHSGKLPLERLFTAPDLSGPSLRGVKISPDGRLVAYLKARDDDKDRFDLWAYDVPAARHRLLVDSRTLAGASSSVSYAASIGYTRSNSSMEPSDI